MSGNLSLPGGAGDNSGQPLVKKLKTDCDPKIINAVSQPQMIALTSSGGLPIVNNPNLSGGISLTISNGLMHLKTGMSGGHGDASGMTGRPIASTPGSVSLMRGQLNTLIPNALGVSQMPTAAVPVVAGQCLNTGQLKIPNPGGIHLRMATPTVISAATLMSASSPFIQAGGTTIPLKSGLTISMAPRGLAIPAVQMSQVRQAGQVTVTPLSTVASSGAVIGQANRSSITPAHQHNPLSTGTVMPSVSQITSTVNPIMAHMPGRIATIATPLQSISTQVNKIQQAVNMPFNPMKGAAVLPQMINIAGTPVPAQRLTSPLVSQITPGQIPAAANVQVVSTGASLISLSKLQPVVSVSGTNLSGQTIYTPPSVISPSTKMHIVAPLSTSTIAGSQPVQVSLLTAGIKRPATCSVVSSTILPSCGPSTFTLSRNAIAGLTATPVSIMPAGIGSTSSQLKPQAIAPIGSISGQTKPPISTSNMNVSVKPSKQPQSNISCKNAVVSQINLQDNAAVYTTSSTSISQSKQQTTNSLLMASGKPYSAFSNVNSVGHVLSKTASLGISGIVSIAPRPEKLISIAPKPDPMDISSKQSNSAIRTELEHSDLSVSNNTSIYTNNVVTTDNATTASSSISSRDSRIPVVVTDCVKSLENAFSVPNPTPGSASDFDVAEAMQWNDGIGTLPGSDLKFRLNEFGMVELITDDVPADSLHIISSERDIEDDASIINCDLSPRDGPPPLIPAPSDDEMQDDSTDTVINENQDVSTVVKTEPLSESHDSPRNAPSIVSDLTPSWSPSSKDPLILKKRKKKAIMKNDNKYDLLSVSIQPEHKKGKPFVWINYLQQEGAKGCPLKLFKEPFPTNKNNFKPGMCFEGIDPRHQSMYCVLSVMETKGQRIRLHFDGFSECYDFWTNADSPYIFPTGWCERNKKILQPPKAFGTPDTFIWGNYLRLAKTVAAPRNLFVSCLAPMPITPNAFRAGMRLEAVDKKNSSLVCVASVADTLNDKLLVHFDGWEDSYDYWCDTTSPYIHPVGWCKENGVELSPPFDCTKFIWEKYLQKTKSTAVPARAFKTRRPIEFEPGIKVEVVDRRNPILIRVATIKEVVDYRIKIHFDGWLDMYDYWEDDDDPDIHPPGWCIKTGHPLMPPIDAEDLVSSPVSGCPTPGCKGVGHIKGAKYTGHHSAFGCPYSTSNLNKETTLLDRLGSSKPEENPNPALVRPLPRGLEWSSDLIKKPAGQSEVQLTIPEKTLQQQYSAATTTTTKNLTKLRNQLYSATGMRLYGPGTGRGRRPKHKFLHWRQKKEAEHSHKEIDHNDSQVSSSYASLLSINTSFPNSTLPSPSAIVTAEAAATATLHQGIHQSVFLSPMLPFPPRDLPLCWDQHCKLLPGVDKINGSTVACWNIDEVSDFIRTLPGCMEQASAFHDEQIDGEAFLLLNQADIVKILNIKLGPAIKIYNSIVMFKNSLDD